jgi:hypothetical protein
VAGLEEAAVFDGADEGVVAAVPVVGFGDGVEVEEFEHEVAVEGEEGVLDVFVELGDGCGDLAEGLRSAPSLANSAASKLEGSASGCCWAKVRPAWMAPWLLSPALTSFRRSSGVRWTMKGSAVRMLATAVVMVVTFAGVRTALT